MLNRSGQAGVGVGALDLKKAPPLLSYFFHRQVVKELDMHGNCKVASLLQTETFGRISFTFFTSLPLISIDPSVLYFLLVCIVARRPNCWLRWFLSGDKRGIRFMLPKGETQINCKGSLPLFSLANFWPHFSFFRTSRHVFRCMHYCDSFLFFRIISWSSQWKLKRN